jgi:uncharacterized protein YlxW (UPF0749 family)
MVRARKNVGRNVCIDSDTMSSFFTDMVKEAFAKVESAEVTRKRRLEEQERPIQLDDLPEFAQKALFQLQVEVNLLQDKVDKQKEDVKRAKMYQQATQAQNAQLHKTICALGKDRLSPYPK